MYYSLWRHNGFYGIYPIVRLSCGLINPAINYSDREYISQISRFEIDIFYSIMRL